LIYNSTIHRELSSVEDLLKQNELFAEFSAVHEGNVWCTGMNMFQESSKFVEMIADFSAVLHYAPKIIEQMIDNPPVHQTYINVNFPNLPADQIKGIRFAHQGNGRWEKEFQKSVNGRGREFYWMVGQFVDYELKTTAADADHLLLAQGYITIVPHKIDNTNYAEKERLSHLWQF
jgi:5'/3'-nucleotidase SurE